MSFNQTIESPNFEKIQKEAGQFTSDAVSLLWNALNDTRRVERMDFRKASDLIAPRVLTFGPTSAVNNLDLQDCSVVSFVGSSSVNFSGMRAPDPGQTRVVIVQSIGSGTITAKHSVTSETANQLVNSTGADVTLSTNKGVIYVYLGSRWRQVAL